jgi:hypothetical protein
MNEFNLETLLGFPIILDEQKSQKLDEFFNFESIT